MTVTAASDAREGRYIIELTAVVGEIANTKTVTVMVKESFEILPILDMEMLPGDTRRRYVQLRLTKASKWETIPVAVSIREDVGNQIEVEPATLTYTKENYDMPQSITVTATDDAVEGDYTLVVHHSRDGYNDILEEAPIRILPKSLSAQRVQN